MSVKSLLTDLADSIRLKSGKTSKMSLEEMAAALMSITVEGDIGFTCGTFTASTTGSAKTIKHGLGQVPGAVLFIKKASYDSNSSSSTSTASYDSRMSIVYGADAGHTYCYNYFRRSTSSASSTSSRTWSNSTTIPDNMFGSGNSANSYYITNINDTSFTTPSKLASGRKYV